MEASELSTSILCICGPPWLTWEFKSAFLQSTAEYQLETISNLTTDTDDPNHGIAKIIKVPTFSTLQRLASGSMGCTSC